MTETGIKHGMCVLWNEARGFGFIQDESGIEYFVLRQDIKANEIGQMFLEPQEPVSFEPGSRYKRYKRVTATDVVPMSRPLYERPPTEPYFEDVILSSWDTTKGHGFCRREMGGDLILSSRDIITPDGIPTLRVGSKLWVRIAPPLPGKRFFRAIDVEIYRSDADAPIAATPVRNDWDREMSHVNILK